MKKLVLGLVSILVLSQTAFAIGSDYEQLVSKENLPYFVQDIGSSIGAADFNKATIINGFGFDAGVLATAQKTSSKASVSVYIM